jgi:hypothetical protein
MNLRKLISKRIQHDGNGVNVAGDVNAVVSANVNEGPSATSKVSRSTHTRIVQRGGRTEVHETDVDGGEGGRA